MKTQEKEQSLFEVNGLKEEYEEMIAPTVFVGMAMGNFVAPPASIEFSGNEEHVHRQICAAFEGVSDATEMFRGSYYQTLKGKEVFRCSGFGVLPLKEGGFLMVQASEEFDANSTTLPNNSRCMVWEETEDAFVAGAWLNALIAAKISEESLDRNKAMLDNGKSGNLEWVAENILTISQAAKASHSIRNAPEVDESDLCWDDKTKVVKTKEGNYFLVLLQGDQMIVLDFLGKDIGEITVALSERQDRGI